ncbi:transcriptional regulator [Aliiroseovarius zhejiangensis]|uniref:Transcriptional regulator n=1 Tax=Aliiroseovarius zhejiangensis TaxID=1632025 RepID=A0ABQ3ITU7_9RHOB|nr:GntR family transcriptional regulator [Aliiroseovarius zhejiangensis]GHE90775.1 transcriptional regulator [Aliiroseovarius zhejiangensis]
MPLAELVYRQLLEDIREGEFHPGERIKEASIAKRLGISRTPVREAIRRLQSEGRVTIEPQRGAVVAELDRMEISELYLLRQQLEGIAARFAAQHASDMEIEQMEVILDRVHGEDADIRTLNQVNWDLHHAIFYAAKNRYLLKAFNAISDDLALLRGARYIPEGRPEELYREHKAIVDAIRARDPERAEKAAKDHIESSYRIHLNIAFKPDPL